MADRYGNQTISVEKGVDALLQAAAKKYGIKKVKLTSMAVRHGLRVVESQLQAMEEAAASVEDIGD